MNIGAKRFLRTLTAIVVAAMLWLPCLHFVFRKSAADFYQPSGLSPQAKQLAARHLALWTNQKSRDVEIAKMRVSNAEWDFMGRSFLVWSLSNMALREPASKPVYFETIDRIIDETLRLEQREGMFFFLMPYAKASPYVHQPPHSLFLDGEIALMLAARRMVDDKPEYKPILQERIAGIANRLERSKSMVIESYPNECW